MSGDVEENVLKFGKIALCGFQDLWQKKVNCVLNLSELKALSSSEKKVHHPLAKAAICVREISKKVHDHLRARLFILYYLES